MLLLKVVNRIWNAFANHAGVSINTFETREARKNNVILVWLTKDDLRSKDKLLKFWAEFAAIVDTIAVYLL